ncbi:hypothetical protein HYALB_00013737 [Hymenoscyphus albidus]|uniref:Protein kinase domain-containing protein n=1 Tax=Hymenoscyphus albidus TaxID=595503 RepID=A0A9N9Q0G7_9HELO|nr:hypothetical protein HYALB_00013737 [Hymenoscyphus albidus]
MILQKISQCFDFVDGVLQYQYTKVLFLEGGNIYHARTQFRIPSNLNITLRKEDLTHITLIPFESYCPLYLPEFTLAPESSLEDYYIKSPNLMSYEDGWNVCETVLNDIRACEILKKHPSPNIAKYHGCQVYNGRVTGLCFSRYPQTLMEMVNPRHLNRDEFFQETPKITKNRASHYIRGVERGIRHIHTLNLVHNDINLDNIMITQDDNPVIIDFDSCLQEGMPLGSTTKRTFQWHDPSVHLSQTSNDDWAFKEVCRWLTGGRSANSEE